MGHRPFVDVQRSVDPSLYAQADAVLGGLLQTCFNIYMGTLSE